MKIKYKFVISGRSSCAWQATLYCEEYFKDSNYTKYTCSAVYLCINHVCLSCVVSDYLYCANTTTFTYMYINVFT